MFLSPGGTAVQTAARTLGRGMPEAALPCSGHRDQMWPIKPWELRCLWAKKAPQWDLKLLMRCLVPVLFPFLCRWPDLLNKHVSRLEYFSSCLASVESFQITKISHLVSDEYSCIASYIISYLFLKLLLVRCVIYWVILPVWLHFVLDFLLHFGGRPLQQHK